MLDGCPKNGPALAVDGTRRVHLVWPTLLPASTPEREPTPGLFYALSRDGRQFTPRQRIPLVSVSVSLLLMVWGARRAGLFRSEPASLRPKLSDKTDIVPPRATPPEMCNIRRVVLLWLIVPGGRYALRLARALGERFDIRSPHWWRGCNALQARVCTSA